MTPLSNDFSRRNFMRDTAAAGLQVGFESLLPAYARPGSIHHGGGGPIELTIDKDNLDIGGRRVSAIAVNGTGPGPLVRLREGQEAMIRVTNRMNDEDASIHWHGLLLPFQASVL